MSRDQLNLFIAILTALTLSGGLVAGAVRYVLVPYIRLHLIEPLQETRRQVTENHHSNERPTVLDSIDDVRVQVKDLRGDLHALVVAFGTHLSSSENEIERVWSAIHDLGPKPEG